MGHTALGHCCLGLIHWHCTAMVVVVGIGHGHSITCCQVRCPFREGHDYGANRGVRWAGVQGVGGWANIKVGNAGGACRSRTWATEEGGQKQNKTKKKVKEREEGEKEYILIEYKAIFTILFKKNVFFEETWQRVDRLDSLDTELIQKLIKKLRLWVSSRV